MGAARPTYEGREVRLGPRARDHYIVLSGVSEGERVVAHGAFKIDSALQIQAKPSMMSLEAELAVLEPEALEAFRATVAPLFENYFAAQVALASDDPRAAGEAMSGLAGLLAAIPPPTPERAREAWYDAAVDLEAAVAELDGAESIEALRSAFRWYAGGMLALEKVFGHPGDAAHAEVLCPMAFKSGASWLQVGEVVLNPYHGASMLRCGIVQQVFGSDGEGR